MIPGRTGGRPGPLALLLTLGLFASACGSGEGPLDAEGSAAELDRDRPAAEATTSPTRPAARPDIPVDALAYDAGELFPTSTPGPPVTGTTTPPVTTAGPATTTGSGGAPVTTVGGGGGGDLAIYQGVLGTLGPDDVVTGAVAPAPAAAPGILPLTGLPGSVPDRPAAVVKIDNGSRARPQTGLNAADLVIEEEVEGGITRFAAVFHSTSSIVGPVRSGRTTDIGVLNGLGDPLLLYSGANEVTDSLLRAQVRVQNRNAGTSSGYWRSSTRKAPSNLYTDTAPHWASAAGGPPPPQFAYRAEASPVPGVADESLTVAYRNSNAAWTWDGTAWLRTQSGAAHLTASGERVSAANVVVVETAEVATGMVDSSGATVPEFVFVGSGPATVFTAGMRIEGTWTRPTLASVATLTTTDGRRPVGCGVAVEVGRCAP